MKVLVTGASGLLGRHLIHRLLVEGHEVNSLVRTPSKITELPEKNVYSWKHDQIPPHAAFKDCDAVIHLAGEGIIDKRWTKIRKKKLRDSRVLGTKNLVSVFSSLDLKVRPKVFISGSAVGYYGSSFVSKTEDSSSGDGFLAELCCDWEKETLKAKAHGIRTVILRTGLVLAKSGGLLSKSAPVILGNGNQWMSWIHIEDMVRFILHALKNQDLQGPYNLTAPNPVTNLEFTKAFSKQIGFPVIGKIPASLIKVALGEMSETVLGSQRILPQRTSSTGFQFQYENLAPALEDLIGTKSILDNQFSSKQFIPLDRKKVFPFFSRAENLETLTPPWLHFHIARKSTDQVQKGSLIEYKLKIHGVPVRWKTLISHWNPDSDFVDDQMSGPYKKWHHVHTFESVPGGTLISDDVTFQIPGQIFGKIILQPFIRRDVSRIFRYRQLKIRELYSQDLIK